MRRLDIDESTAHMTTGHRKEVESEGDERDAAMHWCTLLVAASALLLHLMDGWMDGLHSFTQTGCRDCRQLADSSVLFK